MKRLVLKIAPLLILIVGVLAAVALIKTRKVATPQPRQEILPTVRAVTVVQTNYQMIVSSQGIVSPATDIQLVAEVGGRVVEMSPSFNEGGAFKKGDLLVRLDSRDYELALTRAQSDLARAKVAEQREEAESAVARAEWETVGKGEAGPLALREPQLAEARANVAASRAAVEQAQRDVARCEIRAPFDGRVWTNSVDLGQFIPRESSIARIYGVSYAEVRLPIPVDQLAFLNLPIPGAPANENETDGPRVTLRADIAGARQTWSARIVRTEGEIDRRSRMFHAVAKVEQPYVVNAERKFPLAVGMFVEAEIQGLVSEAVFVLPGTALRDSDQALVITREERLAFRKLEIIRHDGENVIVRGGIKAGERVCISALDAVVDGMRVQVMQDGGEPL